jgi:hypothetical protein
MIAQSDERLVMSNGCRARRSEPAGQVRVAALDSIVKSGDNELIIPSGSSLFRWSRVLRGADFFRGGSGWLA